VDRARHQLILPVFLSLEAPVVYLLLVMPLHKAQGAVQPGGA